MEDFSVAIPSPFINGCHQAKKWIGPRIWPNSEPGIVKLSECGLAPLNWGIFRGLSTDCEFRLHSNSNFNRVYPQGKRVFSIFFLFFTFCISNGKSVFNRLLGNGWSDVIDSNECPMKFQFWSRNMKKWPSGTTVPFGKIWITFLGAFLAWCCFFFFLFLFFCGRGGF